MRGLFKKVRKYRDKRIKRGRVVMYHNTIYRIKSTNGGDRITLCSDPLLHSQDDALIYESTPEHHAALRLLKLSVGKLEQSDVWDAHGFGGIDKDQTLAIMYDIVRDVAYNIRVLDE